MIIILHYDEAVGMVFQILKESGKHGERSTWASTNTFVANKVQPCRKLTDGSNIEWRLHLQQCSVKKSLWRERADTHRVCARQEDRRSVFCRNLVCRVCSCVCACGAILCLRSRVIRCDFGTLLLRPTRMEPENHILSILPLVKRCKV